MTSFSLNSVLRLAVTAAFTVFLVPPLFGQVAIGQWRDHLPYSQGVQVVDAGDYLYYAAEYGLFKYHKSSGDIERVSKVTGLSDIGFSAIEWSEDNQTLVIAYGNTNIDLIQDGSVINVPDIKDKSILGNKTIHKIHIIGDFAYLACGFGIVVLDVVKNEIKDTYYIGPGGANVNVYDISSSDDKLFACTELGVYWAAINESNLANFENWNPFMEIPDGEYNTCTWFNNRLVVNLSLEDEKDTIYRWTGNEWIRFDDALYDDVLYLESTVDHLVVSTTTSAVEYFADYSRGRLAFEYGPNLIAFPAHSFVDTEGIMWIADRRSGLIKHYPNFNFELVVANGPSSPLSADISIWGNRCYVATGSVSGTWGNSYNKNGLNTYKQNEWTNISPYSFPETSGFFDYVRVVVDPFDTKRVFATSYGKGVLEFYNDELVAIYDTLNSPLEDLDVSPGNIRCIGLAVDFNNGNLWVSTGGTANSLYAKEPNGQWYAFEIPGSGGVTLADIAIDDIGQKWIMAPRGVGLFVYNDNGTLDNSNDDQSRKLTQNAGNGNLASNEVYCVVADLDGEIWVGTNNGLSVFYSPESVFSGNDFDAQQVLIEQDGYVQYLLENESITAIAIDGANRKWIGTASAGVFLLSEDGTEEVYHFTSENGPLFSNQITAIEVDHLTGEVFIGTDKGIISYKGTATWGTQEFEKTDVYAYPNPVEPDYDGLIAIKGLVRDADVKITDAAGNVVFATTAEGGQAIWDGNRITGGRAQSGVYLVFASNEDGKETFVTKILFIN